MATKEIYLASFTEDGLFHVYNRTNNNELMFRSDENKRYFLQQYHHYLSPFLKTLCFCLLPNHFHFLIRVKTKKEIIEYLSNQPNYSLKNIEKKYLEQKATAEHLIELEWHRFFTSYSMAFNKLFNRKGNFFNRPFKRLAVAQDQHMTNTIIYIHANPLKHGICKDFMNYQWSSFKSLISDGTTKLERKEVLDWFGNKEQLINAHKQLSNYYYHLTGLDEG